MGVYLGSTDLLGGSGGGIPIGGFAYFTAPPGTTYTSGQEIYTDPNDRVWLRSGAKLTGDGSGALDASTYTNAYTEWQSNSSSITTSLRSDKSGASFDGENFIIVRGFDPKVQEVRSPDGTVLHNSLSVSRLSLNLGGSVAFYNDTHVFLNQHTVANGAIWVSSGGNFHLLYLQRSSLTTAAAYNDTTNTFIAPVTTSGSDGACTNPGESNERFWFVNRASTTVTEYTFNSAAANGTNPFTATGNTITASSAVFALEANGNTLYLHHSASVSEYNATTRAFIRELSTPSALSDTTACQGGFCVVPDTESDSGNLELWFQRARNTSGLILDSYSENQGLIAPYKGDSTYNPTDDSGTRDPIVLETLASDGTGIAAHYGNTTTEEIFLWQRIA